MIPGLTDGTRIDHITETAIEAAGHFARRGESEGIDDIITQAIDHGEVGVSEKKEGLGGFAETDIGIVIAEDVCIFVQGATVRDIDYAVEGDGSDREMAKDRPVVG